MARVVDPRDYLDPPSRRMYNETLEEEIMAHITPNNFNMYISSLKLKVNESTVYGPQLTRVSRVSSETGRIIFHKMKVKSLSSSRYYGSESILFSVCKI